MSKRSRSTSGTSLLELLVALVIIGIAIAGITEITFINGLWTMQSLNKIDNIYAAKLFLERIGFELREAHDLKSGSPQTVSFAKPVDGVVDSNGFPTTLQIVMYQVIPDTSSTNNPPESIVQASYDQGTSWTTVLSNLVGPQPINGGSPKVFQFVDQSIVATDPAYGLRDTPTNATGSVVVNLELRKLHYGTATASDTNLSLEGLRTEVFLRSSMGAN